MRFIFEQIRTGGDRNFGYLVGDREAGAGALIDPSYDPAAMVERARAQGLEVRYVINTHGHPDHTNGNEEARRLTKAPLAAWKECPVGPDLPLEDRQELELGSIRLRFLHTPGHSADHLVVHLPAERVAITGDLLFVGKVGGTMNDELARVEHRSLERALAELPDETTVWPGHDYGVRPASTIALEKSTNPFLLAKDLDAFLELKRDWALFKQEHGLK